MKRELILPLAILGLLIASILLNVRLKNQLADNNHQIELLSTQTGGNTNAKIVDTYKRDDIGHVVVNEMPVKTEAQKAIAVGGGYLDTVAKALKISSTRIDELTKINSQLIAQVKLLSKDTGLIKYYKDKSLDAEYNTENDSLLLKYNAAINVVNYWKRSWFLASKKHYIDFFSDDPRVTINGVKRFTKAESKPGRFGIGVNASYSYVPELGKWFPVAGVGLQWSLIRF